MIDLHPNVPPTTPPAKSPVPLAGIIVLVCIAAFAGGVFATNLLERVTQEKDESEESYKIVEEEEVIDDAEDEANVEEVVLVSTDEVLEIDWIDPASQPSYPDDSNFVSGVCWNRDVPDTEDPFFECEGNPDESATSWSHKLGTVVGGTYDGRDFVMTTVPFVGMGTNQRAFYLLVNPESTKKTVVLSYGREVSSFGSNSNPVLSTDAWLMERLGGFVIDTSASVPEFEFEQIYYDTQGNEYFFTGYWHRG